MQRCWTLCLISFFLFLSVVGQAQEFVRPLMDEAHILSTAEAVEISSLLEQLREKRKIWMVIQTIPSLHGRSIEEHAEQTFRKYQIGQEALDNGLLFTMSSEDRKMRLEVGYGLEGDFPDVVTKRIIDQAKTDFQRKQYSAGLKKIIHLIEQVQVDPSSLQTQTEWSPKVESVI